MYFHQTKTQIAERPYQAASFSRHPRVLFAPVPFFCLPLTLTASGLELVYSPVSGQSCSIRDESEMKGLVGVRGGGGAQAA